VTGAGASMDALVVTPGQAGTLRVERVPRTAPVAGEVLVETLEVGVCGTDRAIAAGAYGTAPPGTDRLVIGHEVLGRVTRDGGGLVRGELVAATVRRPCGTCANCAAGGSDACTSGAFTERGILALDGFAAETFAERPAELVRIPAQLGRAGVLAEPASICRRGLRHAHHVGRRQGWDLRRAVVLGAGAIGVLTALMLRLEDVETWVVGRKPATGTRLELLQLAGIHYASSRETTPAELARAHGPADLLMDAAGDLPLLLDGVRALAANGVACAWGISAAADAPSIDASDLMTELVLRNKSLIGSTNAAAVDWQHGVSALAAIQRRWPEALERVLELRVPLDDFAQAFAHRGMRATVRFA
jgi:threonine dehydrogenase-like Zn-dependent dehydrogenase